MNWCSNSTLVISSGFLMNCQIGCCAVLPIWLHCHCFLGTIFLDIVNGVTDASITLHACLQLIPGINVVVSYLYIIKCHIHTVLVEGVFNKNCMILSVTDCVLHTCQMHVELDRTITPNLMSSRIKCVPVWYCWFAQQQPVQLHAAFPDQKHEVAQIETHSA